MSDPQLEFLVTELEAGLTAGTRQGLWRSSRAADELMLAVTQANFADAISVGAVLARCQLLCRNAGELLEDLAGEPYGPGGTDTRLSDKGWEG